MKTIRPPVKWHGGKHYLARRIIAEFPPHHTYVEPFGGAASVLLNNPPSHVEVYNDLNNRLARFFRVLREQGDEFNRWLALTPYSEVEFRLAAEPVEDEVEQARRDFVRWRQSLGGRGDSFSFTLHRVRRQMADVVSGYLSAIDEQLPVIVDRPRTVQFLCRPAIQVIHQWDGAETLFYCDPPCLPETRHPGNRADCSPADKTPAAAAAAAATVEEVVKAMETQYGRANRVGVMTGGWSARRTCHTPTEPVPPAI